MDGHDDEAPRRRAQGVDLRGIESRSTERAEARDGGSELQRVRLELQRERARLAAVRVALEVERERYGDLFDFAPIGYASLDGTGIIQDINLSGARLLGMDRSHLRGSPLLARMAPADRRRFLDHLRRCRTGFLPATLDVELARPDGSRIPVQLMSKRGSPRDVGATILCAIVDMSDREEAVAQRSRNQVEHERMEHARAVARAESAAKDHFLAVLSHELRNPLSPILFTVEMLERGQVPPERVADAIGLIKRNLDLEVRLIDDLLDVSRITHRKLRLERQIVDLHDVVRDVADGVAADVERAGLTLSVELTAPQSCVDGDPARLRQIVWNLVSNAIRNTPPGGKIAVRTYDIDECVALTVSDSGRGVAPDRLERIFEPFDQVDPPGRRRGGLGLGLAICRGLVEAHGGRVSATSDGLGSGATFTVVLPTATDVGRPAPEVPALPLPVRRLRVLVVEDDGDAAEAMATVLGMRGHEVAVARSVDDAVAHSRESFDVLVSDIGLPDGSGLDVMAALGRRGTLRGVALSGFGAPDDVQASLDGGFARHLTKPVHLDELVEVIEALAS
jgi:PAS domain S-box-containing protein